MRGLKINKTSGSLIFFRRLMFMNDKQAKQVRVRGTVQGVGFRPTVWRLAQDHHLLGDVCNDGDGVLIRVVGAEDQIENFLQRLSLEAPRLSQIESMDVLPLFPVADFHGFDIVDSKQTDNHTRIAADAAICDDCRAECLTPGERRYYYPFTNCTYCGPRFSIVHAVPYDRAVTTMADFAMCAACSAEYRNPLDRRFHAQPIACPACGPKIWLEHPGAGGETVLSDSKTVITQAAEALKQGKILAMRGLGGFQLACDASNGHAVQTLRARKHRYAKPFALMAEDLEIIGQYCRVSEQEKQLLQSAEAPIVLLTAHNKQKLSAGISPNLTTLGFMLPYTPLHLLLSREFGGPLVMTSGNLSDEPQVTSLSSARSSLAGIADVFLMHDRDIANRIDDSVVRIMAGSPQLIRRARGYAPRAIKLPDGFEQAPDVLAYGGEVKSTFCLLKDGAAILSQHQGDLEDAETYEDFEKNLALYSQIFEHRPQGLAADQHPDYFSTKLAQSTAKKSGLPLFSIQHHHAHIASCLADNNIALNTEPVLGIVLDGLGYGADHTFWGGEFLLANYCTSRRLASFTPVAMLGGAQAIKEPWRNTYAHIINAMGRQVFTEQFADTELFEFFSSKPLDTLDKMLAKNINTPLANSCGRLFDAVAAAVNLCRDHAHFEGQGAISLEDLVDQALLNRFISHPAEAYGFELLEANISSALCRLDAAPMWRALLQDIKRKTDVRTIATRFHAGLALALAAMVNQLSKQLHWQGSSFSSVVLSGGCFQNKILLETSILLLQQQGYRCLWHSQVPANDGGLAMGQAVIAAARYLHRQET